ncbi:MAG: 16S rRNA (guanine(966)-N(2))-methyltransferase RsmD [Mycobacteriales bacterium]
MTRIIAGEARGRRILVPTGKSTRPTSDRAREALFASIGSIIGPIDGLRVLDLYAGSGAFGLEALSRGAAHALMVDNDAKAVAVLRLNVAALALPGAQVRAERVEHLPTGPPHRPYDVVLADPPYAVDGAAVAQLFADLLAAGWLAPDAVIAVERSSRDRPWMWPDGIEAVRERKYGEATLWYGRHAADARSVRPAEA